jgi:hypothetical protein
MNLHLLIYVGVAGVLLDILLHVLQMFPKLAPSSVKVASWITLASCLLGGASLIPQWNLPLLIMEAFVGGLAIVALVTGKEVCHEGT